MAVLAAATVCGAVLSGCGGATETDTSLSLGWGPCGDLADYVTDLGIDPGVVERLQCTSVDVPLDYDDPDGRTVELALSRITGTDPGAPTLFVNPGGPGVEGRSMAATVASSLGVGGTVVGIDLRGTGASTGLACPEPDDPDTDDDAALTAYAESIAEANADCVGVDPGLVASMTTANAARDLDAVRRALGLDTVDFLGVSWGTVLGAELQSRFPDHLRRVVLDSMDYTGTSAAEALRVLATADPDAPPGLAPEPNDIVPEADDAPAPDEPDVPPDTDPGTAGDDTPLDPSTEDFLEHAVNPTAGTAYICNSLGPVGDTETQLAEHRALNADIRRDPQRRIEFPADSDVPGISLCTGWPLDGEPTSVANTGTDLLIIGHRDEFVTPYPWALDAHDAMGGALLTIGDSVHGSTVGSSCGGLVTEFLASGRLVQDICAPQ